MLDPVRGVVLVVLGLSEIVEVGLVQPVSTDVLHPAILSKIGQGKAVTLAPQRSRTEKPPGNRFGIRAWPHAGLAEFRHREGGSQAGLQPSAHPHQDVLIGNSPPKKPLMKSPA